MKTALEEEWRDVPYYPDLMASSWGRIMRKPHHKPLPKGGGFRVYRSKPTFGSLARAPSGRPLRMVNRYRGIGTVKVHRMVCLAFHGEPPTPEHEVMHLDENPQNNRPENLQWGTRKENLNAPGFISYCKRRTGEHNPYTKGRKI